MSTTRREFLQNIGAGVTGGWLVPKLSLLNISVTDESENQGHLFSGKQNFISPVYSEIPLGKATPKGWLKEMLIRMKTGSTGHLDSLYSKVVGQRNGWLGGDGDVWERGPYWIDGLLPLAYILDDSNLKAKVQPWIEWSIRHQQPSGYFGPMPRENVVPEPGLQKGRARDWWPKMVMLKVFKQYYSATHDQRVIKLLTNYFHYQLKQLPKTPLDHWSWWGAQRGGDNLLVVNWLYNMTGDQFLLDLADLLYKQTVDWTGMFLDGDVFKGILNCMALT